MKEAFPDSCDWRGFAARTHYAPAAAPFDESSRPRHCPCSRLQSCTFAPSHRALGHLTPGWAWCRWCERWRGCSGRLRPSLRHAGGRCGGTQSALGCAAGRRLRASSAYIRCWAGRGASGGFGVKYRFGRASEAATAAAPSGCIHIGVARALAWVLIASIDVPVARYLPAPISRCALPPTSYGLAPSCRSLTGLTGRFHSRHTSTLSPVSLRRSSRAGSRPLTPCNVLAAAERRSALNLCKMHHIRPRPRCIPRFHLPLKRYPWRLVVSEGHLDHRWGTLGPAGHLRVELPKRFGSGSWASVGGTAQARWWIARTGGWAAGAGLR